MNDPREWIETGQITCEANTVKPPFVEFWVRNTRRDSQDDCIVASWPEVVEFARAILAADEAWLDSRTPTLEGLRAKYPGRSIGMARVVCGPTYCWRARVGPCESPHIVTEIAALRWLAAKLEELT